MFSEPMVESSLDIVIQTKNGKSTYTGLQVYYENNYTVQITDIVDEDGDPLPKGKDYQVVVKSTVEDTVVGLLPLKKVDEDPYPQVTVSTYQSLAAVEPPPPPTTEKAMTWLGRNWSTLGMTCVAMFSLLMLRSMVRSTPTSPSPDAAEFDSASTPDLAIANFEEPAEEGEATSSLKNKRRTMSGPNLRDELSDIVKEDPDAAANILKSWIASAG